MNTMSSYHALHDLRQQRFGVAGPTYNKLFMALFHDFIFLPTFACGSLGAILLVLETYFITIVPRMTYGPSYVD